jgi:Pregnancy-associated plasma protein-A
VALKNIQLLKIKQNILLFLDRNSKFEYKTQIHFMKKSSCLVLLTAYCFLLNSCHKFPRYSSKSKTNQNNKRQICGDILADDYNTYLNKIIELQLDSPFHRRKPIVFTVKIHAFLDSYEQNRVSYREAQSIIEILNKGFEGTNISFVRLKEISYKKLDLSVDDLFTNANLEETSTESSYDPSYINLYLMPRYDNVVGFAHYPIQNINRIFIARSNINDPALVHEMGHLFGLLHTFEEYLAGNELVNGKNCSFAGDKICDTPADPAGASFTGECKLVNDISDISGRPYKPDLSNFMSYYGNCRNQFSKQQKERMYFVVENLKCELFRK